VSGIDWDKLPDTLGEHGLFYSSVTGEYECDCLDTFLAESEEEASELWFAHLAAVVRAWVEGQMTEEWGTSCRGHYYPFSSRWSAEQSLIEGETLARRLVAPWAPVEGENS
jgi:hypothetical protein